LLTTNAKWRRWSAPPKPWSVGRQSRLGEHELAYVAPLYRVRLKRDTTVPVSEASAQNVKVR
jgi:hypothetical protein